MKCFLITILALYGFISFSQKNPNPDYYLNNERVDLKKLYLNSKNIDSIGISKKTVNGEINIFTKKKFSYLTLNDVLSKYINSSNSSGNILIRIDGKTVNDISGVRIDDTYFIYVKTEILSEVQYLEKKYKKLIIVEIFLETEERKPQIVIRGKNEMLPAEMYELTKK